MNICTMYRKLGKLFLGWSMHRVIGCWYPSIPSLSPYVYCVQYSGHVLLLCNTHHMQEYAHTEDILCVAFGAPNLMATASFDGQVRRSYIVHVLMGGELQVTLSSSKLFSLYRLLCGVSFPVRFWHDWRLPLQTPHHHQSLVSMISACSQPTGHSVP